jgi:hypothetical protein
LIRTPDFAKRASASLQKSRLVFTGFRGGKSLLGVLFAGGERSAGSLSRWMVTQVRVENSELSAPPDNGDKALMQHLQLTTSRSPVLLLGEQVRSCQWQWQTSRRSALPWLLKEMHGCSCSTALCNEQCGQGPQGEKRRTERCQFSWENHMGRVTESEFKLRYKVTVHAFY